MSYLAAAAALVLGLAACSDTNAVRPPEQHGAPRQAGDPGVVHVHGLGVDPADGVLYAATHSGLFRIPGKGEAARVAERHQDTMGFAVVGPRHFVGSGHPDMQKDPSLPPRLGFIRSTNAGETWETVSLGGEVDFHALRAAGNTTYGWDAGSGRLMASTDSGESWETRSTLGLRDLVASPDDPNVLLASTENGVVRSSDGGRTFTATQAPPLSVLAWPRTKQLFGLDQGGTVHASVDGGASWAKRGTFKGTPEALAANGADLYAAVSGQGIFKSSDGGATWDAFYDAVAAS